MEANNHLIRRRIVVNVVIEFARNNLIDYSSDENDEILEKVDNFAELTVPYMSTQQFKMHFRMTPGTFEDLVRKMHLVQTNINNNNNIRTSRFPKTPLEKECMIMIWYLSNLECFRLVRC